MVLMAVARHCYSRAACWLLLPLLFALAMPPAAVAAPAVGREETGAVAVLFQPAAGPAERAAALARHAGAAGVVASRATPRLALVRPPAGGARALAERLRAEPAVRAAAPDRQVRAAALPADYDPAAQPALARLAAPDAWATGATGAGVTIAVVDTGLDTTHPEFAGAGKIIAPAVFVSDASPSFLCGPTSRDVTDDHGHGTHVAGIAAAGGNNGGVVGLAWAARLLPVKTLDACGIGTFYDLLQGLYHAAGAGARVINVSLGGYLDARQPDQAALIALIQAAVDDVHAAGALVVAAAGNDSADIGARPYYPAAAARVVAVAATRLDDERAGFSNYGAPVAVAAPGAGIYSTLPTYPTYLSAAGTGYGVLAGTSMAAPHVAGLAALLLERDPALTPDDLAAMLAGTAVERGVTGRDPFYGVGRIDAGAALTRPAPAPARYFAEGYTGAGFTDYLTLQNAGARPALAMVRFHDGGPTGGPARRYVALPAASRVTLNVNALAGAGRALAVTLAADSPDVYAERPIYFDYALAGTGRRADGGHVGGGAPAPAARWYFAEGYTGDGFDEYLAIMNPGAGASEVRITYYLANGPPVTRHLTVPAGARATVAVHDATLGVGRGQAVSALVESVTGAGIVVERPVYFAYRGSIAATGGHTATGATAPSATWYFADASTRSGVDQYLTLLNPGTTAGVARLTYLLRGGGTIQREVPLPAGRRTTVAVHRAASPANPGGLGRGYTAALAVDSSVPIVAERPVYFVYRTAGGDRIDGGHIVPGATAPRPRWHFAEGYTGDGFDEYLTIFNPSAGAAPVRVTYYLRGGPPQVRELVVQPRAQAVLPVHEAGLGVGRGQEVSATVESTSGAGIVVERTVYFRYAGSLTGGHAALGQP
jgi:subtilisin family serine protease